MGDIKQYWYCGFIKEFDINQYWISNYKISQNRKVINRRTYIWYKFGVYLAGGNFDNVTMEEIIKFYIFRILKNKHSNLFNKIESFFVGKYIKPSQLIDSQKVTSLDVERYIAALYSCYVSRNASRKIIKSFKYKKNYFDAKVIIINDCNEIVGVKYKEEKIPRKVCMMNGEEVILTSTSISERHVRNFRENFMKMKMDNNIAFSTDLTLGCYRKLIPTFIWFFKFWCTTETTRYITEYHELNQILPLDEKEDIEEQCYMSLDENEQIEEECDVPLDETKKEINPKKFKIQREWIYDEVSGQYGCRITIWCTVSTDGFPATHPKPSKVYVQFFPHIFYAGFDQFGIFVDVFVYIFVYIFLFFFC